jgi:hypothetical protein
MAPNESGPTVSRAASTITHSNAVNDTALLIAETTAIRELNATVVDATDIGSYAVDYGLHGWPVFPCNGKVPAIANPHPMGSRERRECKGGCGRAGHGIYDATTDLRVITYWWGAPCLGCNIGCRVPESMFVLDIDPRHGGLESLNELERKCGPLPATLMTISGRGDGGCHYFYRAPAWKPSARRLGPGIDIKTHSGYVLMPGSIHPATSKPYKRIDASVAAPSDRLIEILRPDETAPGAARRRDDWHFVQTYGGDSVADAFSARAAWADILEPHGWRCLDADPDADGARWLHPTHTSACSATIRHGCLFVYSTNTPFETTGSGNPCGYTRFRAYAVLEHYGDLSAAARALSGHGAA